MYRITIHSTRCRALPGGHCPASVTWILGHRPAIRDFGTTAALPSSTQVFPMAKWRFTAQVVCLAVLLAGAKYAVARERLRHADLHEVYQRINQQYFSGRLPDAFVHWGHLDNAIGRTYTYQDG